MTTFLRDHARYLGPASEEYVERIAVKARIHSVGLRVESVAALMASLAALHEALTQDGEIGSFRTMVNECVNEIVDASSATHGEATT